MPLNRLSTCLVATFLSLGLSACQDKAETAEAPTGACKPEAAASLVGMDRVTDDQAKKLTASSTVRQIKPGDPVTMDYRKERVTIVTDDATGKIVRAMCG